MRSLIRRFVPFALALSLVAAAAPAASAAEAFGISPESVATAERGALAVTNSKRAALGLRALRWDTRVAAMARARAENMAATDTMSHSQADGTNVFDLISESGITWYGAGEILAWNNVTDLDYSVGFAVKGWMESPTHKAIVVSTGFNYVGFGMAVSPKTGIRYYAGVYLKGPDRTASWSKVRSVSKSVIDARRVRVTIRWSGADTKLQVLSSGLRYFQMQARRAGGTWKTYDKTTRTYLKRTWTRGKVYEFRVRSRDRAGNWSRWALVTIKT
ncbi:MAG: CAP domain-containing protein [Chloroflexota bacterium]